MGCYYQQLVISSAGLDIDFKKKKTALPETMVQTADEVDFRELAYVDSVHSIQIAAGTQTSRPLSHCYKTSVM